MPSVLFSDLATSIMPLTFYEIVVAALLRCSNNTGSCLDVFNIIRKICPEKYSLRNARQCVRKIFIESLYIERVKNTDKYRLRDGWQYELPCIIIVNGMEYHVATRTCIEWMRYLHTITRTKPVIQPTSPIKHWDLDCKAGTQFVPTTENGKRLGVEKPRTFDIEPVPLSRKCRMFSIDELLKSKAEESDCLHCPDSPPEVTIYV
ncbi:uncharacterized protein LOC117100230 [Anneissia japonica]|uniref:uncharacterized protein LOC117100230 n=1 Tax=Anneissia japonica TaxID=1529436 RepID=UPI001425649A|nr:uncharacterized protein LOC117100230 [Anneissia japonica]